MRIIAALGQRGHVIGGADLVPWTNPDVHAQILDELKDQILIMGRRAWQLFGHDLPYARAIVLSRRLSHSNRGPKGPLFVPNLGLALRKAADFDADREVLVVGGASVFRQALPLAQSMTLAWVKAPLEGDLRFPDFDERDWWVEDTWEHPSYEFLKYQRRSVA